MIVQWRFKILDYFAIHDGLVVSGEHLAGYRGGRAVPQGMRVYKPGQRKWDFVDYTGRAKRVDLDFDELTCILEMLGYIKFVESSNGD